MYSSGGRSSLPLKQLLLLLSLAASAAASVGPDCAAVTAAYASKGLDVMQVKRLQSGAHLSVCPQRATCCTRAMEDALLAEARSELRRRVRELAAPRAARLDSLLGELQRLQLELIEASRRELDHNLKSIYGYSYLENKTPFTAFFDQLAAYSRGDRASGPVSRVASDLFDAIAGRVYALTMNNYNLDRGYLACAQRQFSSLRPLGAMPDRLGAELLKAFVTGRSFLLGLAGLAETLRGAASGPGLQFSADCQRARLRAHYCAWCDGVASAPPCYNLCANVAAGCLAGLAPLAAPFDRLLGELERMTDLVDGASGMHMALRQLGFRISSGIMEMQERKDTLQSQITSTCGRPSLKTGAIVGTSGGSMLPSSPGASGSDSGSAAVETPTGERNRQARLAQLVGSVRLELRALRGFFTWEQLVQKDCQLEPRPDACWNGTAVASYQRARRGTSGPDLAANPEVSVPESALTRPAEPVAARLAELQAGVELATSLPRGGENYRSYRENTDREQALARLLPMQRGGSTTADLPSPPLPAAPSSLTAGGSAHLAVGSGSGAAPPQSPSSATGRIRPPLPPLLVLSTLAPTPPPPPPPPRTPPPAPPPETPLPGGAGSGDRPPVGSGDAGPPPVPALPDTERSTEQLWLETTTTPPTTTTTSTTTTTTTTTTSTTTTTTPTTTTVTTPQPTSTATTTPARIDTGGSGEGQPDEDLEDLSTTEVPPQGLSSLPTEPPTRQPPPGPAGSGDEESSLPPMQPTLLPPVPPEFGGQPSGGEEPPTPPLQPEQPPLVPGLPPSTQPPVPPPRPRPDQPTTQSPFHPPPDLWLPKEPDEQGGAEGRRGEGSVHEPMRMTGARRGLSAAAGRRSPASLALTLSATSAALAFALSAAARLA